jgi:hypothetical protein
MPDDLDKLDKNKLEYFRATTHCQQPKATHEGLTSRMLAITLTGDATPLTHMIHRHYCYWDGQSYVLACARSKYER